MNQGSLLIATAYREISMFMVIIVLMTQKYSTIFTMEVLTKFRGNMCYEKN